jgi:hypothetical protein
VLQCRSILGRQRIKAQGALKAAPPQSNIPACGVLAQICAPACPLAGRIDSNTPLCISHQPHQRTLRVNPAAGDAGALRDVLWAWATFLLF